MKAKRERKEIPSFYERMDPDIREALLQVHKDRKEGKLRTPPRNPAACRSLEDLARFVFKLAHLDGDHQMLTEDGKLKRWVWFGHEFRDRLVDVVEQIAPRLRDSEALEELRLVATRVSANGLERLRRILPNASITVYTDQDSDGNWKWSQASYIG